MANSIQFPSREWFEALAHQMIENHEVFHNFGPIDCTMVVKVGEAEHSVFFEIAFECYAVKSIRVLESLDHTRPEHFVIEAPLSTWQEMLQNIQSLGALDLEHTLNFLTFPDHPMLVSGPDQLEVDAFYRYNESLQRFFNGASSIATNYATQ